jgi:phosphosulfolactate synthase
MQQFLDLPTRTQRPREYGLTHVLDKGKGIRAIRDLLDTAADYIDIVKLGWGTGYVTRNLREKIRLYQDNDVLLCFGGTMIEVAIAQRRVEAFRGFLSEMGITHLEISDGVAPLDPREKSRYIRELSRDFVVLSEVGSKDPLVQRAPIKWVEMIERDLEAGAWKVIVEARESGTVGIFRSNRSVRENLLDMIAERIPPEKLLFEAPVKAGQVYLIKRFGSNVNLGNIAPEEVIPLETLRLGLRGDTMPKFILGQ